GKGSGLRRLGSSLLSDGRCKSGFRNSIAGKFFRRRSQILRVGKFGQARAAGIGRCCFLRPSPAVYWRAQAFLGLVFSFFCAEPTGEPRGSGFWLAVLMTIVRRAKPSPPSDQACRSPP